ncbi:MULTISPECIES: cupin domain-containing protein [Parafrankia]|uniref:cupin domain-containing protein n=1 Tax=Parafrankia TaxID=2994362 RepID=UPI000ABC48FB|nr:MULTISPECIES: cupin domain-containing protein [Parafrankia]MBE3205810.1 cupin domain-containing protein [Parafrankia sp. CH37]
MREADLRRLTLPDGAPAGAGWYSLACGTTTPVETHTVAEVWALLSGRGHAQVGEHTHDVEAGDVVVVPSGAVHALTNTGEERLDFVSVWWHPR